MTRGILIWIGLVAVLLTPLILAANSPLLAWRTPVYIAASFAGIVGLALLFVQPLLIIGGLPGLQKPKARRLHRLIGPCLLIAVILHVAGLWITSPPDVIDALTFTSPTPFSIWGVIAMWALFGTAFVAHNRRRLGLHLWRRSHKTLAIVIATGTASHALLIEGIMEPLSKALICALMLLATALAIAGRRPRIGR